MRNANEIKYVTYPCLGVGMLFGNEQFIRSRTYSIILAGPSSTVSSQDPSATFTIGWAIPTSLPEVPALSHWRVDLSCASIAGIVNVNSSGGRAQVDGYLHTTSTKKKHKKHMKSTALDSTWHVNNSLGWYRTVWMVLVKVTIGELLGMLKMPWVHVVEIGPPLASVKLIRANTHRDFLVGQWSFSSGESKENILNVKLNLE